MGSHRAEARARHSLELNAPKYSVANDWTHSNALWLASDGNFLISVRYQDWVMKCVIRMPAAMELFFGNSAQMAIFASSLPHRIPGSLDSTTPKSRQMGC